MKIVTSLSIICISILCFAQIFSGKASAATAPGAPTGLTATAGNAQVSLTWIAPTNNGGSPIVNYQVFMSKISGKETWIANASSTTYTATGLTNGQIYYFQVTAITTMGSSPKSAEVNATPSNGDPTVPNAPTGLTATAENAQVSLTWIAPANNGGSPIVNYQVFEGIISGGETWIANATSVNYTATGLTNGQIYYYQVTAINVMGSSPRSAEVNATPTSPIETVPGAPTGLTTTAGNTQVILTWNTPANNGGSAITGYCIFCGITSNGETLLTTIGAVLTYTTIGLTNGQVYYFKVCAVNSIGNGANSTETTATPATVPTAPLSLTAKAGRGQVVLTWTAPSKNGGSAITGYNIYQGTTSGGETLVKTVGNVLTCTITGLRSGHIYYFKVAAVNAIGVGAKSNEASARPN